MSKTTLITGIGKGIGKALAQKFLAEGFRVIGTSTTGNVDFSHQNLFVFKLDLRDADSIEHCVEEIKKTENTIDILINNAGVLLDEDESVVVPRKLRDTLEVNLIGTANFTEHMISLVNTRGHIINISSTAGSIQGTAHGDHFPGKYPAYKISKAALNMYTRTLARRLEGSVVVSSVHPGWVKTDMGGQEADLTPEQAAEGIYTFTLSRPETGQFWFKGEQLPW
ncbi:SDR family NAD(P)-dependent oxidoreductase [Candidatus Campbellbacteria bacterium]|nr:MAG: SDR family NAD(P)-dependent oxidoreductase [Candidatus Campbellbacteria bacterium]